jgi:hypothetical protein
MPESDDAAERDAEQRSGELDEFDTFDVLAGQGVPTGLALSLIALWRAGDPTREQMERVADEFWAWVDMRAERSRPPTRNGRRPEPWRPVSPTQMWRQAGESG